jgi:hypothetical protein
MANRSVARKCLELTGLFEAELLTELMLRFWTHPMADDGQFRNHLLETAADVLKDSTKGKELIEGLPPAQMNLVAAIWFSEWSNIASEEAEDLALRKKWLDAVRRALPSCFCDHERLS